jgi:ABC-type polysaccharide/polyol phosphate export permease
MKNLLIALSDLAGSYKRIGLVGLLGWQDIRTRYRRSVIGPLWITISMGVMIGTIGLVFGKIFNSPMSEYLPFLSVGIILWGFISGIINEGSQGFIAAEGIIKQLPIPLSVHIFRVIWRNLIILCHNLLILPLVFLAVGKNFSWVMLFSILGLLLTIIFLSSIALILGLLCARYRDLPQIVTSILQVFFYLTPIIWAPNLMPGRFSSVLLHSNPFYHLIEIVRAPILGNAPQIESLLFIAVASIISWTISLIFFARLHNRVAYWL